MPDYHVYPGVSLGEGITIHPFVLIGFPPTGNHLEPLPTFLGNGSTVRSHTVIYAGNRIGARLQTGHHVLIRELNEIGSDVSVGSNSVIEHHVRIADRVRIHSRAFVPEYTTVEADAWIGPGVILTNAKYPRSPNVKRDLCGPMIRRAAMIGANATILPGVEIGERALVGAGSVVTHDVPPLVVVAGNPARVLRSLNDLPYAQQSTSSP